MTKIIIFSDLHGEFNRDYGKSVIKTISKTADIAVVAGDIANFPSLERSLSIICGEFPEVVYVPGNHDYYLAHAPELIDDTLNNLESKLDNFTWLNKRRVKIGGVNFIGATLWFKKTVAAQMNKKYLNDFVYVPKCDPFAFDEYNQTVNYFNNTMQPGDVVVTHHMPSYQCINKAFKGSNINCYFANDLDKTIIDKKPALWIFGHSHQNADLIIDQTRLICNPIGYPGENPMFNPGFILDI